MDKPMSTTALAPAAQALCVRLREAMRGQNWTALTRVDAEIAQLLRVPTSIAASAAERAALGQLRQAHQQAYAVCEQELARLSHVLTVMRENRDGWQAYVESHAWSVLQPAEVTP